MSLEIFAEYDKETGAGVARNDELCLATKAETLEVLAYKLQEMMSPPNRRQRQAHGNFGNSLQAL